MPEMFRQTPEIPIGASPTVKRAGPNAKRGLIIATVAAFFMAFVGALGTGSFPLWQSLTYWLLIMELGAMIGLGVSWAIHQWGRLHDRPIIEGILTAFLIAVPLSSVVTMATMLLLQRNDVSFMDFVVVAAVVFIISCVMTAINYAVTPIAVVPPAVAPQPANAVATLISTADQSALPQPSLLMQRLPLRLRHAQLLAIEAEDHYLRVHTDAGSELILMRLSDAVAELGNQVGARTHRSWWVARDAVVAVVNDGARTSLQLGDTLFAPVSRNNRAALKDSGWFTD